MKVLKTKKFAENESMRYIIVQPTDNGTYEISLSLDTGGRLGGQVMKTNLSLEDAKMQAQEWSKKWGFQVVEKDKSTSRVYQDWLNGHNPTSQKSKIAQVTNNPLDGKSNQQARTIVNKLIPYDKISGFYNDKDWSNVNQIFKIFNQHGLDWQIISSDYYQDHNNPTSQTPVGKKWKFEISFNNNKGKLTKLYGTVVAAGAGTVEDPLSKYDITIQVS